MADKNDTTKTPKAERASAPVAEPKRSDEPAPVAERKPIADPATTTEPAPINEAAVADLLAVPEGDVLLRRIRGHDGVHTIGFVKLGRLYTVALADTPAMCLGEAAEFEPAFKADRTRIEDEARKQANAAARRAQLESELAKL